jgi:hypothetical protein
MKMKMKIGRYALVIYIGSSFWQPHITLLAANMSAAGKIGKVHRENVKLSLQKRAGKIDLYT